jgi:putative endonuclease
MGRVDARHRRGRAGEETAARHLEARGWRILARNWRAGHKEADVIVERDGIVAFVEVKTRRGRSCGHPLESITPRKRREVEAVALEWLRTDGRGLPGPPRIRFDAVAVHLRPGREPRVEHLPDAWRPGEDGG